MEIPILENTAGLAALHVNQIQDLFPIHVSQGKFRIPEQARLMVQGGTYDPHDQGQSSARMTHASQARDNFISQYGDYTKNYSSASDRPVAWNKVVEGANNALQQLHDQAGIQIQKFFDRSQDLTKRELAFRRWTRTLDHTIDIYTKLQAFDGIDRSDLLKACENNQVQVRNDIISELARSEPYVVDNPHLLGKEISDPLFADAKMRATAKVLLHSIKNINVDQGSIAPTSSPNLGGEIVLAGLEGIEANDRLDNCALVVPATVGVLFGGEVRALAGLDDQQASKLIKSDWREAYEGIYSDYFRSITDMGQIFDALQSSSPGTLGVLKHSQTNSSSGHVTVIGNFDGVVCQVEGGTTDVIARNPVTGEFVNYFLTGFGIGSEPFDIDTITKIGFLPVDPAEELTEHQRATAVAERLHEPFFATRGQAGTPASSTLPRSQTSEGTMHSTTPDAQGFNR